MKGDFGEELIVKKHYFFNCVILRLALMSDLIVLNS